MQVKDEPGKHPQRMLLGRHDLDQSARNADEARARAAETALRISLSFALAGVAWITLSDWLLESFVSDRMIQSSVQVWKGTVFILVIAAVLYVILRARIRGWEEDIAKLRAKAEADWALLTQLIDRSRDAIFVLDGTTGRILDVNETACANLGYGCSEILTSNAEYFPLAGLDQQAWRSKLERLHEDDSIVFEFTQKRKDGTTFAAEASLNELSLPNGTYILAVVRDISARKKVEEQLRTSQLRLQVALEIGRLGTWGWNLATGEMWWDEAAAKLFGRPGEALDGFEKFLSFLHPKDRARVESLVTTEVPKGKELNDEYRIIRPDGTELWIADRAQIERDADGKPVTMVGACVDITERKIAQIELERRRSELELILDTVPAAIFCKDSDGRIIWVNREYLHLTGKAQEEVEGFTDQQIGYIHADMYKLEDDEVLRTGQPKRGTTKALESPRGERWVNCDKFPILDAEKNVVGIMAFALDITERRAAELATQARLEVEQRLTKLASALPGAIFSIRLTPDGMLSFPYASPKLLDVIGIAPDQVTADAGPVFQVVHREDLRHVHATIQESSRTLGIWADIFRVNHPERGLIWVEGRAIPQREADGNVLWHGFLVDVTSRQEAEQAARAQLDRMALMDRITRAIGARQDLNSIFMIVVRSLEEHLAVDFGFTCIRDPSESALTVTCVGKRGSVAATRIGINSQSNLDLNDPALQRCLEGNVVYEVDLESNASAIAQRLGSAGFKSLLLAPMVVERQVFGILGAARRKQPGFSAGECEFLRLVSEHAALAAHQAQLHAELQKAYDNVRQTQGAMLQQERLRALGQMASGIAHDINNAISPVTIYSELLLQTEPGLSTQAREFLEVIQNASKDVARTVARMREFYRQREPQLALLPLQLNQLVRDVINLTRARWRDMPLERGIVIECRSELADGLPEISGVESEIREALTNLVLNAVDAMPNGGLLVLRTGSRPAQGAGLAPVVFVEVRDSGVGMDEDTRRRCVEPFFTTKGERGTGLGLAMVLGVARRNEAQIEIESSLGSGTTVRLSFPQRMEPANQGAVVPAIVKTGPRRILAVDDDPVILNALRTALEVDRHVVTIANGGEEGMQLFRAASERGEPFELVITDLGMPNVDGRKVAKSVKWTMPKIPVIMLTGWGERLMSDGECPEGVDRVMSKPPTLKELRQVIATLFPGE